MNFDNVLQKVSGWTAFGFHEQDEETYLGNDTKVSKKTLGISLANFLIPLTALGIIGAFAALAPRYIPKLAAQRTAIYATAGTAGAFILVPTVAGLAQTTLLAGRRAHQGYVNSKPSTDV